MEFDGLNPKNLLARAATDEPEPNPWEPPPVESLATEFSGIEIRQLLSHGGTNAVYLGRQESPERDVVVKILPEELARNPELAGRFEREALALANLNEPGVVSVFNFGKSPRGLHFLVLEFVAGTDLERKISVGPLPRETAILLTRKIALAIAAAHRQGIVHRDLKPSNVLLTAEGEPKVTGFGIAKLTGELSQSTNTGEVSGSAGYAAPEQREGGAVDARTDVFALGALLFHLLTGAPPVGGWAKSSRLSRPVRRVIARALQPDPADRFPNAAAFAAALGRAWIPRRRVLFLATAAGASGLAFAAGTRWLKREDESETEFLPISQLSSEGLANSTERFGLIIGIPSTQLRHVAERARASGIRLAKLRIFRTNNQAYFATLWIRDDADWEFAENLSPDQIVERHQQLLAKGFEAVDFGPTIGRGFSCAVWRKPKTGPRNWIGHELLWVWEEDREAAIESLRERGFLVRSGQFRRDSSRWRHYLIAAKTKSGTPAPNFFAGALGDAPTEEIEKGQPVDLCLGGVSASTLTAIWSGEPGRTKLIRAGSVVEHLQASEKLAEDGWEPVSISAHPDPGAGAVACASLWKKS